MRRLNCIGGLVQKSESYPVVHNGSARDGHAAAGSSAGVNPDSFRVVAQTQMNLASRFLAFRSRLAHPPSPSHASKIFSITQSQPTSL